MTSHAERGKLGGIMRAANLAAKKAAEASDGASSNASSPAIKPGKKKRKSKPDGLLDVGGSDADDSATTLSVKKQKIPSKVALLEGKDRPDYLPNTIVAVKKDIIFKALPVMIQANGRMYELSTTYVGGGATKKFWDHVSIRYRDLTEAISKDTIQLAAAAATPELDKFLEHFFPTLLDQGTLRTKQLSDKTMGQAPFKKMLSNIVKSATNLQEKLPKTGPNPVAIEEVKVPSKLISTLVASQQPFVTMKEHNDLMTTHVQGLLTTGETIRKELVNYSILVATIADEAIEAKHELNTLITWMIENLKITQLGLDGDAIGAKASTTVATDAVAIKEEPMGDEAPEWSAGPTGKQKQKENEVDAEGDLLHMEGEAVDLDDEVKASDRSGKKEALTMPQLFLRPIGKDAHSCRCLDCESSAKEAIVAEALEQLRAADVETMKSEVKAKLLGEMKEEMRPSVKVLARQQLEKEENKKAKDDDHQKKKKALIDAMKPAIRAELIEQLTPIVKKELKASLEKKMNTLED
ncbi:hypothetical protein P7C71_g919, partial [Lecanoromycetidae sp. Uapishka_2]